MTTIRADLHVHSVDSYDGEEPVDLILEHAANIDLDAVVITDHDVMRESLRAAELAPEYGLIGIPGVEVSTAHGHLLAIGVDEMPPHRVPFDETVAWIRDHGGVAIVPHPFQRSRHGVRRRYLTDCDAVEVFNAWLFTGYRNRKARRFAAGYGYPGVAASDAQTLEYVGRAFSEIAVGDIPRSEMTQKHVIDAIRKGETRVSGRRAPIPMASKHYALAGARKSLYYSRKSVETSATYAKASAIKTASVARIGAIWGAHELSRLSSMLR